MEFINDFLSFLKNNNILSTIIATVMSTYITQLTTSFADDIVMLVVDPITGKKANFSSKKTIIEAFKNERLKIKSNKNLDINNRLKNNNILKFY